VLGDTLYSGSHFKRVCLHAESITLEHPESGEDLTFTIGADFEQDPRQALRAAVIEAGVTNAFRLIHGAADAWPGWYVDRLGDYLLSQSERELTDTQLSELERLLSRTHARGAYHKRLSKHVRRTTPEEACPNRILGEPAPERFTILENGLQFELSFQEGYSVGLFLDQRDNRRRLLTHHAAGGFPALRPASEERGAEILNTFAYTCAFSVCAAKADATVTSLDLSRKYLDWGRRNFELNGIDPARHDFIYGDAFDWMKRLHKKGRMFDGVFVDPPTFSRSKQSGLFRAEKDFSKLVRAAVQLLRPDGVLFASTNVAGWTPADFLQSVRSAVASQDRRILKEDYRPQPPDFPINREEPGYLKTAWLRIR
jgi:23S rRNA (cytosine1962-C5)-methyltransferase